MTATPTLTKAHVAHNSGNIEWYTPKTYIDAAVRVMGSVDLDPASCAAANEVVGAKVFYSSADDGLTKTWCGKVWMNPPYEKSIIGQFTSKLAMHVTNGDVTEAIVLVNNATETKWCSQLVNISSAVVFPAARIKFWTPYGKTKSPLQGQAFFYIGNNVAQFRTEFEQFGWSAEL